jgi:hypothetical protein
MSFPEAPVADSPDHTITDAIASLQQHRPEAADLASPWPLSYHGASDPP